tara:strand:+ start:1927 stop:2391 length:465 start_codon:yes stop_codon:yes gene_type:complete
MFDNSKNLEEFKSNYHLTTDVSGEQDVDIDIEVEDQYLSITKEVEVEMALDYDWDDMKDLVTDCVHVSDYLMLTAALSEWITELQMTHHIVKFEASDQRIMNLEARLKEQTASFTKTQGHLLDLRQALVGIAAAGIRTHEEVLSVAYDKQKITE